MELSKQQVYLHDRRNGKSKGEGEDLHKLINYAHTKPNILKVPMNKCRLKSRFLTFRTRYSKATFHSEWSKQTTKFKMEKLKNEPYKWQL